MTGITRPISFTPLPRCCMWRWWGRMTRGGIYWRRRPIPSRTIRRCHATQWSKRRRIGTSTQWWYGAELCRQAMRRRAAAAVCRAGAGWWSFSRRRDRMGNRLRRRGWGDARQVEREMGVTHWDRAEGPLADSESGTPLALPELRISRWKPILSGGEIRAVFGDHEPFLTERLLGKGRVYFCATLPEAGWSTLGDGAVLVPMLQRILQVGAGRFTSGSFLDAGDASLVDHPGGWTSLGPGQPRDIRTEAGVYQDGSRLVAVNRPADEDDPGRIAPERARALFAPLETSRCSRTAGAQPGVHYREKSGGRCSLRC